MARLRGRAAVPHGHWKTTTFTAGLRLGSLSAPMLLDGPMDGDAFRAYVTHVLVPELTQGDIVVMDNLPAHKVTGVRLVIEQAGQPCSISRPIRQTSTPWRWHSQSSRRS